MSRTPPVPTAHAAALLAVAAVAAFAGRPAGAQFGSVERGLDGTDTLFTRVGR